MAGGTLGERKWHLLTETPMSMVVCRMYLVACCLLSLTASTSMTVGTHRAPPPAWVEPRRPAARSTAAAAQTTAGGIARTCAAGYLGGLAKYAVVQPLDTMTTLFEISRHAHAHAHVVWVGAEGHGPVCILAAAH